MTKRTVPTFAALRAMTLRRRTLALLKWARTKPPRKRYDAMSNGACALAQFGQEVTGSSATDATAFTLHSLPEDACGECHLQLIEEHDENGTSPIFHREQGPWVTTFGALVKRLEKHLATTV